MAAATPAAGFLSYWTHFWRSTLRESVDRIWTAREVAVVLQQNGPEAPRRSPSFTSPHVECFSVSAALNIRSRASCAIVAGSDAPSSAVVLSKASGSIRRTRVRPSLVDSTVTLHGSSSPTRGSAVIAANASGGLHAPRMTFGRNLRPRFSRKAQSCERRRVCGVVRTRLSRASSSRHDPDPSGPDGSGSRAPALP